VRLANPSGDFYTGGELRGVVAFYVFDHFIERAGSTEWLAVTPHRRSISYPNNL
jgi:hypothetical protein